MELTLKLLNKFCENILSYLDIKESSLDTITHKRLREDAAKDIVLAISLTPNGSDFWHVEFRDIKNDDDKIIDTHYILWTKKAWLLETKHREELLADQAEYKRVLDIRRDKYEELKKAVCDSLELNYTELKDDPMVTRLAMKLLKSGKKSTEVVFGVDVVNVPSLPDKHVVLDERGKKLYEL